MCESLVELQKEYKRKNIPFYFFYGKNTLQVLKKLYNHNAIKINSIGYNIDYSPYALQRDSSIQAWAQRKGVMIYRKEDSLLCKILEGQTLSIHSKKPYRKFIFL